VTLPLIPGVRPDPEPGETEAAYKSHGNAVLDLFEKVGGSMTNVQIELRLGWPSGMACRVTSRLARERKLRAHGRAGHSKLYSLSTVLRDGVP
jgi:hypothetical protein